MKNSLISTKKGFMPRLDIRLLLLWAGAPDLSGAEVLILGTPSKADFTPNKAANMTTQAERALMIGVSTTSTDNDAVDIKISNDVTSDENWNAQTYTYNEAVIVLQKGSKRWKVHQSEAIKR